MSQKKSEDCTELYCIQQTREHEIPAVFYQAVKLGDPRGS